MPGSAFSDRKLKPNLSQKLVNFFLSSSSSSCFPCFSSGRLVWRSHLSWSACPQPCSAGVHCVVRQELCCRWQLLSSTPAGTRSSPCLKQHTGERERASSYRRVTFLPNDDYFEFPVLSSNDDTWMEPADHMSFSDFVQAIEGHWCWGATTVLPFAGRFGALLHKDHTCPHRAAWLLFPRNGSLRIASANTAAMERTAHNHHKRSPNIAWQCLVCFSSVGIGCVWPVGSEFCMSFWSNVRHQPLQFASSSCLPDFPFHLNDWQDCQKAWCPFLHPGLSVFVSWIRLCYVLCCKALEAIRTGCMHMLPDSSWRIEPSQMTVKGDGRRNHSRRTTKSRRQDVQGHEHGPFLCSVEYQHSIFKLSRLDKLDMRVSLGLIDFSEDETCTNAYLWSLTQGRCSFQRSHMMPY